LERLHEGCHDGGQRLAGYHAHLQRITPHLHLGFLSKASTCNFTEYFY
jgi:hypothetical protein